LEGVEVLSVRNFSKGELDEVFPINPIREVDFEIRFAPRFRIQAEMWKFQEVLVSDYPDVGIEATILPTGGRVDVTVFQNLNAGRVIKVSAQNFVVAFSAYKKFEDFKEEVVSKTNLFGRLYDLTSFSRIGLRYVNEIMLPTQEPDSLERYARPFFVADRMPPLSSIQQFALQFTAAIGKHMATVRTAMLPGPLRTYVLDIDAHTEVVTDASRIPTLLDDFHDIAQKFFLDHVTDEYKDIMRGKV
jgi:uncharacterized protein (TIGR04255 family)